MKDYPYDEDSQAQIVNFVEYCYSYKGNMQSNYGLYVYVYNPQGLNISTNSKSNKIQMAVSYDSEGRWRCRMTPRETRTTTQSSIFCF